MSKIKTDGKKKKSNSTARVQRHRKLQSKSKKMDIREKNTEKQRLRRENLPWHLKQAARSIDSDRKRAARANRTMEQKRADRAKDAERKRNSRGMQKIKAQFTTEQWNAYHRVAKTFPKTDVLNLTISDIQKRGNISIEAAFQLKKEIMQRFVDNHFKDVDWLTFAVDF